MFVVVDFDALAQARDFQIERRQVVFLCWMQDFNQGLCNQISSRLNSRWQTDWAIEVLVKNLNSTARPFDQRPFSRLDPTAIWFRTWIWWYTCLLLLISMLWHRQAIFKLKGDKLSSSAECRIWTSVSGAESPAHWMPADKPTELSMIKLKTWTQQPFTMFWEHWALRPHCRLAFAHGSRDMHFCY